MDRLTPGPIVLAAGDIDGVGAEMTAQLLKDEAHATVLALGDNAYRCGTTDNYAEEYDPTWGRPAIAKRTWACPGNHEFGVCGTAGKGYYGYFQATHDEAWAAGSRDYYSINISDCNWQLISLNTEIKTSVQSRQLVWLREELTRIGNKPKLAFFHRPRFSSGNHASQDDLDDLWQLLCEFHVEIALSGHDHSYERFYPQNEHQELSAKGVTQFVVGTGGKKFETGSTAAKNVAVPLKDVTGVLRLELRVESFLWKFLAVDGTDVDEGELPINSV